ncbi:MAG TPA: tRNA (guanosine(37)-N1)-methyltransferase TrmD [Bryobacterales bacterium]|nr:tRNA (guanosine(37)-N1)-methyltransferase TrmD [Bryobacterales bacterium]
MQFHLVTIFPDFFKGPLDYGVVARARQSGAIGVRIWDLRDFTSDRRRTVDDRPFGGGEGMLLKVEPIFLALEKIKGETACSGGATPHVVLLSAQGRPFDQAAARRLARSEQIVLVCGRYEGVDERVAEHLADEELSVGDFVLSGGELAAAIILDAVARLAPGVLGNVESARAESFEPIEASEDGVGLLDSPQYTRPADFRGWSVPEILLSGRHEDVRRWRRRAALAKTLRNRPDLLEHAQLSAEDRATLEQLKGNGVLS